MLFVLLMVTTALGGSQNINWVDSGEEFVGPFPSWKNVKDYGATGNGSTDDTSAIQAALNDFQNLGSKNYCVLYFPAGTYRITATLATSRASGGHENFSIIGHAPSDTTLKYDGSANGTMFILDSWYCKISRLTFDGNSKAGIGIWKDGGFSTICDMSDLIFKNMAAGIRFGGNSGNGQAEHAIRRCQFLRCGVGVQCANFNSLDIWVWDSLFQDCGIGCENGAGNYHALRNVFLRSTNCDLSGVPFIYVVMNNVSIGSKRFMGEDNPPMDGELMIQGNKIYDTTSSDAIRVRGTNITLLDNTIKTKGGNTAPAMKYFNGTVFSLGNTYNIARAEQPDDPYASQGGDYYAALDNNVNTKVCYGSTGSWFTYQYAAGATKVVTKYALTTGDDLPGRDPKNFRLLGSNTQGRTWTTLDTRTGTTWSSRFQRKEFSFTNTTGYNIYRLVVDAVTTAGNSIQFSELELIDGSGNDTTTDQTGFAGGADWGLYRSIDTTVTTLTTPSTVDLPATPPNNNRTIYEVQRGTGNDAQAIQTQINAAANQALGARPVVHL